MAKYNIIIFSKAQDDILKISNYISGELCSPNAADKLLTNFYDSFQSLQEFPLLGKKLDNSFNLRYNYRWIKVNNYIVFYTILEESNTVAIILVLYGSSNYLKILT